MKTAVDRVQKDKARLVDARFASLCAHYLFDADFCEVASGWEKCAVEEKRAGQPTAHLAGSGRATLRHAELELRCRAVWSELHHPEHGQLSVAEMLERESGSLAGKRPAAAIGR